MSKSHRPAWQSVIPGVAVWLAALPLPAQADPALCDSAARRAAVQSDVPVEVLLAITRTETGRSRDGALQPWPWTVNMEGEGRWFESLDTAKRFVFENFKRGARSFDVGCFQINYKWHGAAFASIDAMFDPEESGRYAASLLTDLYARTGSWSLAAGAYHSGTPVHATRYIARFETVLADLRNAGAVTGSEPARGPGVNGFPLLRQTGQAGVRASLVPLQDQERGAIVAFDRRASL